MSFAERHAQIDPDPVVEIERRLALWASVPDANGFALKPFAKIIPDETLRSALAELKAWRETAAKIKNSIELKSIGSFGLCPSL